MNKSTRREIKQQTEEIQREYRKLNEIARHLFKNEDEREDQTFLEPSSYDHPLSTPFSRFSR